MVVRKVIHHMRQRPDQDKHVVASTMAFVVVGILMLVWGFFFFKNIQSAAPVEIPPVSNEVLSAIRDIGNGPPSPQLPSTYLPIVEPSATDTPVADSPISPAQQKTYEDLMREDDAAMRALRGNIAPTSSTTTTY